MLDELIHLILSFRKGYEDFQDSSRVGQSEMDRRSRRLVNTICSILIALILIGVGVWVGFCS